MDAVLCGCVGRRRAGQAGWLGPGDLVGAGAGEHGAGLFWWCVLGRHVASDRAGAEAVALEVGPETGLNSDGVKAQRLPRVLGLRLGARAALKSVRAIPNPRSEDRRPKETRRPKSELIATPAEQLPFKSGHSRNSELPPITQMGADNKAGRQAGRQAGRLRDSAKPN